MMFNLFPGIQDTPFTGSHDLVECGQVRRIGGTGGCRGVGGDLFRGAKGLEGLEGMPEGPPLEDEPPDRTGDGEC
ncbi:hypothetical protein ACFYNL_05585 [Streptomyces sp. NPDC007808]|uniref:hypothetical protein n=1 Tax=Streptomyces sp. NPDC007808 TaxID=3364779 RepID=UPI0036937A80